MHPITAIPITLGNEDYKKILPEKTYLDIKDFPSPQALANRLIELHKNDDEFNEYIRRKNAVVCKHPGNKWFHEVRYNCELCKYLHGHRNDVTTVANVLDFWSQEKRCTKAEEYFRGSFEVKS
jgi:uncharacterized Fe-S cluster-containing MiaB family protein